MKMKPWQKESDATSEERELLCKAVERELAGGKPGDWSMNLDAAAGVLVFGVIEGEGQPQIFECDIRRSNVEAEAEIVAGELALAPQRTSLLS